jgi:hypothetical protein
VRSRIDGLERNDMLADENCDVGLTPHRGHISESSVRCGTQFFTDYQRRLRNDVGDLPIWSRALRVYSSDCDGLNLVAADSPSGELKALRLKPSPALSRLSLRFGLLSCHCFLPCAASPRAEVGHLKAEMDVLEWVSTKKDCGIQSRWDWSASPAGRRVRATLSSLLQHGKALSNWLSEHG